jgi:carboxyl-terminal processing protease
VSFAETCRTEPTVRSPPIIFAVLLFLLPLMAGEAQGEEATRGEFPHTAVDLNQLLSTEVPAGDAAKLFEQLRLLLLERMGTDVVTEDQLYLGAMQGMLLAIDEQLSRDESPSKAALPASGMILPTSKADALNEGLEGYMTGIGIEFELYTQPGVLVVAEVLPDSPALQAGILRGDRIIAINRQRFQGRPLARVLAMLQGEEGTTVELELVRLRGAGPQRFSISLERSRFEVPSVQMKNQGNGIGYIRISHFHRRTPKEVKESVQSLEQVGADRLILDLRNSPGGDLMAALEVADLFVPPSTVLLRMVEPGKGSKDLVASSPCISQGQLVVLVNRWTLGAAESFAVALQEHGRAYIMGESTMGSARTETLISLGPSLVVRLESVRLQTPTGKSWQLHGLDPDLSMWNASAPMHNPLGRQDLTGTDLLVDTAAQYLETHYEPER